MAFCPTTEQCKENSQNIQEHSKQRAKELSSPWVIQSASWPVLDLTNRALVCRQIVWLPGNSNAAYSTYNYRSVLLTVREDGK